MIRHRWRSRIKNVVDEAALLALVNDYLKEWTWSEKVELPQAAWPGRVDNAKSLSEWTFRLAELHREYQGAPWEVLSPLQKLLLFFTHASVRMAQLARTQPDTPPQAPQPAPAVPESNAPLETQGE